LIRDIAGQSTAAWTFTDPGLIAPDAVAASVDGKTILAASSTTGILARFDSSGANPVFVPCKCTPTELLAMTAPAVYQVTEPANGLLWIFDSNPANPRVLFVPVSSGASAGMGTETQ
jgi:hypothetical protein